MNVFDEYMKLSYDLSGSISKNRFRLELLWGASKMFDLFEKDDFCVVFDYKCDVEIHFTDSFEFYQLKTHKVQEPYRFSKISKQDKSGKSIFGKLYVLKNDMNPLVPVKIAIVSNAFLKIGKNVYSENELLHFSDLNETSKKSICKSLCNELGNSIDLSNVDFIYTSMNLLNPENDLKGKIIGSFESIMKCEPEKPNALFRLIKETVEAKACYELKANNYDELKKNKGITKKELLDMLCKHVTYIDTAVEKADRYISENIKSPRELHKYKTALVSITKCYVESVELKSIEKDLSSFLNQHIDSLPENNTDTIEYLYNEFIQQFSIEFSDIDKKVFILLVLLKWEDGKYE